MDLANEAPANGAACDVERFGESWRRFLSGVNEQRIDASRDLLTRMLATENLDGRTFLDVGCGSGLHWLAARLRRPRASRAASGAGARAALAPTSVDAEHPALRASDCASAVSSCRCV